MSSCDTTNDKKHTNNTIKHAKNTRKHTKNKSCLFRQSWPHVRNKPSSDSLAGHIRRGTIGTKTSCPGTQRNKHQKYLKNMIRNNPSPWMHMTELCQVCSVYSWSLLSGWWPWVVSPPESTPNQHCLEALVSQLRSPLIARDLHHGTRHHSIVKTCAKSHQTYSKKCCIFFQIPF